MSADSPKTEEERQDYVFNTVLGGYIKQKQDDGATSINLKELNPDLLRTFFNAGWGWGKAERPDKCPVCMEPLDVEEDGNEVSV